MKTLTFEQTRGTKTFHLPFKVDPEEQPQVTIVVRRMNDGSYRAGVAVCNPEDNFCRRLGRKTAFHRLVGRPFEGSDADQLINRVGDYLIGVFERRLAAGFPDMGFSSILDPGGDLDRLHGSLDEHFNKLDKNRAAMEAQ